MPTTTEEKNRRWLIALAAATAIVMFALPLFYHFPLLDPDEGLHASIAQEMLERGNWIAPSFLGRSFLDKPILYFWAQAASLKVFGETEAAVRLPGLLFGFFGAVTTGLLAWAWFGRTVGWTAGVFYATTILPAAMAQAASHDVALIPWINLSLLLLWESEQPGSWRTALCIFAAGVFLGLSILTKGMMGVTVVGLVYGGWQVLQMRRSAVKKQLVCSCLWRMAAAFFIALLAAAPWYLAMERQNPDFLQYYFFKRHLLAFATASQPHGDQPWWYYLPILLGGGLPWIGYLSQTRRLGDWETGRRDDADIPPSAINNLPVSQSPSLPVSPSLLWFWLIGWTVFLTLAQSKLATYLWPAFPPLAMLAAITWTRWLDGSLGETARRSFARTFVGSSWMGPIVLPAALLAIQWACDVRFAWPTWAAAGGVAVVALTPLWPWKAGRRLGVLAAAVLSLAAQFTVVMIFVMPAVAENYTARDLARYFNARYFNRQQKLPPRLLVAEERIGSLVFYLDPRLRAGLTEDRLDTFSADFPPKLRPGDVVALPKRKLKRVGEYLDLGGRPYETVGRYRLYRIASGEK